MFVDIDDVVETTDVVDCMTLACVFPRLVLEDFELDCPYDAVYLSWFVVVVSFVMIGVGVETTYETDCIKLAVVVPMLGVIEVPTLVVIEAAASFVYEIVAVGK